jgi:UDP-N-acetylmuramate--alanine ligase
VTCFADADGVLVPDIYPGREKDTGVVHARDMVAAINKESGNATYIPTFEEIRLYLDEHAEEGDLVVTVGSGDVYRQTKKLL